MALEVNITTGAWYGDKELTLNFPDDWDVSIYESRTDTIGMGFTPEREQKQIDLYKMAFNVFREKKDVITGVTFWNLSDRGSWLDRRGPGKAYPLLLDEKQQPKKAFWEVVKF